jgi:hypothetical protein
MSENKRFQRDLTDLFRCYFRQSVSLYAICSPFPVRQLHQKARIERSLPIDSLYSVVNICFLQKLRIFAHRFV